MNKPIAFTARMADLSIGISCLHDSSRQMCADYLSRDKSVSGFRVSITPDSLSREQERLRRNQDPGAERPETVEFYSLCRRIAERLPEYDRFLFHGSSLAIDGQGVLFTAKSGTGKSTHTRLWRQVYGDRVVMINDDKPFLHVSAQGVTVYGTPWRGKHRLGSNISAPLRAICIVCRAEENRIERISSREALPILLQQTYSPEAPDMLLKTLALVERLSRTVPIYILHCNMDPSAAVVACEGLNLF